MLTSLIFHKFLFFFKKRIHSTNMGLIPLQRLLVRKLSCSLQRDSIIAALPKIKLQSMYSEFSGCLDGIPLAQARQPSTFDIIRYPWRDHDCAYVTCSFTRSVASVWCRVGSLTVWMYCASVGTRTYIDRYIHRSTYVPCIDATAFPVSYPHTWEVQQDPKK